MESEEKKEESAVHHSKKIHGFVARTTRFQEIIGGVKEFFKNPSYPRTVAMIGILVIALAIPVTITVLGKTTHIFQFAYIAPPGGSTNGGSTGTTGSGTTSGCNQYKGSACNGTEMCQYNYNYKGICNVKNVISCSYNVGQCGYNVPSKPSVKDCTIIPHAVDFTATISWAISQPGVSYIDISNSSSFSTYSHISINNIQQTSISNIPNGFSPSIALSQGPTYYVRTWDGHNHSPWTSFTFASCAQPEQTCAQAGGVCVGEGSSVQNDGPLSNSYANTDCTGGALKQYTCSNANTFCCPKNNVIQTTDTGVICTGSDQNTQGTCWYNNLTNITGPATFISNLPVVAPQGKTVLYTSTKGASNTCGNTNQLPYFMPNGIPTACLGSSTTTQNPNPSCSSGKITGTCYTNNSCGSGMSEIMPVPGSGDKQCTSPYRICCASSGTSGTTTTTPGSGGSGGTGGSGGISGGSSSGGSSSCQNGLATSFNLSFNVPGIGKGNFQNGNPLHTTRFVKVDVVDLNNNKAIKVTPKNGNYSMDSNGTISFTNIQIGSSLDCSGKYKAAITLPGGLRVLSNQEIQYGKDTSTNNLTATPLLGDIANVTNGAVVALSGGTFGDNKIDINDYNIMKECLNVDPNADHSMNYFGKTITFKCGDVINLLDYPDGGTQEAINSSTGINEWGANYNELIRSWITSGGSGQ